MKSPGYLQYLPAQILDFKSLLYGLKPDNFASGAITRVVRFIYPYQKIIAAQ
jgi:hypothetical protein